MLRFFIFTLRHNVCNRLKRIYSAQAFNCSVMRKRKCLSQQRSINAKKPKARVLIGKPSQSDVSVASQLKEASERLSSNGLPSAAQLIDVAVSLAAYNISFLRGQGCDACADVKKDNASTIKLAENGRSNSDRAKHIQARCLFVKRRLDEKAMRVTRCPTREMIADVLTKPIQGEQLRALRDVLLVITL